jgi:hypothetical protein
VGGEGSAPLLFSLRGGRALEVIERELGINDKLAPARQSNHHVRTAAVNGYLQFKVPVPIHSSRLKEVLQYQFARPATLAGIGENPPDALHLHQRFIKPGLDLTLRLHDRRISLALAASDQPYDERADKNSDHERDDYRRHGTLTFYRAAAYRRPALRLY